MIPKIIHYCWIGDSPKPPYLLHALKSWKENCPDYKIIEWNDHNIALDCDYAKQAYEEKKWAFVVDYFRAKILYEHGGIYLDTDMLVINNIDIFLNYELFLGKEDEKNLSAGILGAIPHHKFLLSIIDFYMRIKFDKNNLILMPEVLNNVYRIYALKDQITILEPHVFYPLPYKKRHSYYKKYITEQSFTVHLWAESWKTPQQLFMNKKSFKNLVHSISAAGLSRTSILNILRFIRAPILYKRLKRLTRHFYCFLKDNLPRQ